MVAESKDIWINTIIYLFGAYTPLSVTPINFAPNLCSDRYLSVFERLIQLQSQMHKKLIGSLADNQFMFSIIK
ncbi:hypothetical protein SAMN04488511_109163 [Pedobacter suwonensis]|uniref:Uncharacterized protein n=1 Tax=Pedobacter suwonensis TaxID=332999 RepID=A0A1I0TG25_9SPHI|nr:hypothetical protein SAMN04488511_109163 [Pedobacter suwonensis]